MKGEYVALQALLMSDGYKVLQALWAHQHRKIVEAMRKAGKRGTESAWRYYAGQQEGFELAITQPDRALNDMLREMDNEAPTKENSAIIEELLNNARESKNGS